MLGERQRHELLAAMGIELYVLREAATVGAADAAASAPDAAVDEVLDLVVACTAQAERDPAAQRLRAWLPLLLGLPAQRIRWLAADARGQLPEPPTARAYLALGAAMPRALGANLSTMQQMSAVIAAAEEAAAALRDGLSKRALWQALKPLARQLRPRMQ